MWASPSYTRRDRPFAKPRPKATTVQSYVSNRNYARAPVKLAQEATMLKRCVYET